MADKTMREAFHEAYAEIQNPTKNANNPAFKSKYANLEEMLNVTKPVLVAVGFSLVQQPVSEEGRIGVHTRLLHKSGDEMDFGSFTVDLAKHDAQGAGSAITYCRRYSIGAIFGLAQEDDDGNGASGKTAAAPSRDTGTKMASEGQVKAMWGKSKQLGLTAEQLDAGIARYTEGRASHPDEVTAADARKVLDALEEAITKQ